MLPKLGTLNIARSLKRSAGWRGCEPPKPADDGESVKPPLTSGTLPLKGVVAHKKPITSTTNKILKFRNSIPYGLVV